MTSATEFLETLERAVMKEGHWRSMWGAYKSKEVVRLIGSVEGSDLIVEAIGSFKPHDKGGEWITNMDVEFIPFGWMPTNEIPAEETFFVVGKTYMSKEGFKVKIIFENHPFGHPYACVQGDDGNWRYNRPGKCEMGRSTGTPGDLSDPHCLLLPSVKPDAGLIQRFINWLLGKGKTK